VLEYDDVMNKQREVVYRKRREALRSEDFSDETKKLIAEEIERIVAFHCAGEDTLWQLEDIVAEVNNIAPHIPEAVAEEKLSAIRDDRALDEVEKKTAIIEHLLSLLESVLHEKETFFSKDIWVSIERSLYLRSLDTLWMNHLDEIDYLRQGIGLRGIAQKDPLIEYKREAYDMFLGLMDSVRRTYLSTLLKVEMGTEVPQEEARQNLQFQGANEEIEQFAGATDDSRRTTNNKTKQEPIHKSSEQLIGRNDPCPCGSGLKYKKCGAIGAPEHTRTS
jgi:preprotein translocase subunit SecA